MRIAELLDNQFFERFVHRCGKGYEIVTDLLQNILDWCDSLPLTDERFLATARIRSMIGHLLDRQKLVDASISCLDAALRDCEIIHLPEDMSFVVVLRSRLAHCCIKRNNPEDRQRAKRILNGRDGPQRSAEDTILNRMQFNYQNFDKNTYDANTEIFSRWRSQLQGHALSVALENRAATALLHARTHFASDPDRKSELIEEAVQFDEMALPISLQVGDPRSIFIRAINLVRSLQEVPRCCDRAAQAHYFSRLYEWAATGIDERHMRLSNLRLDAANDELRSHIDRLRSQDHRKKYGYVLKLLGRE